MADLSMRSCGGRRCRSIVTRGQVRPWRHGAGDAVAAGWRFTGGKSLWRLVGMACGGRGCRVPRSPRRAPRKVITAAATIMILVFASFALGPSIVIKQFGLGL